ncbi:MAG: two-component system sensor histidine kinase ZraS [Desulfovibrio sp.]|nr:two-component system sensor histidine kinase ZraS [Desulfovibrio sp.]
MPGEGRLRDAWAATAASSAPSVASGRKGGKDGKGGKGTARLVVGGARPRTPALSMPLGWVLGSAALILIFAVALVTYLSILRSEEGMADLLAEKGSSLIMAFESSLRTGLRGDSTVRLQVLLEEMARSPDIEFVAVTMPDGTIVAHSERTRLGETLRMQDAEMDEDRMAELDPTDETHWTTVRMEGRRVFVVYRHFLLGRENWPADLPLPTIFLGLDVAPFEITRSQNRSYATALSIVTFLMGLLCLLAVSFAQRATESRRRQYRAEGKVHELEEEVRRREKLAAIGTMAAGVAHEVRNPLSSIKGYATYFRQRFSEGSEEREAASIMVREVNRLNRVITDLLGLSRPSYVKPGSVDLGAIVTHVLRLIRQTAAERHVDIVCRTSRRVPKVYVDMERLGQALLNLCLNALDAMPDGGTLTIAIARAKNSVCLMVRDTGTGMSPDTLDHIFDPYCATKGSGTGLGLPLVHKLVTAHGGRISVSSREAKPGKNGAKGTPGETIFRIWLPLAPEEEHDARGR